MALAERGCGEMIVSRGGRRSLPALAALSMALALPLATAQQRCLPLDCLPDAVAEWRAAEPDPEARHGAADLPGIVLGPAGESTPTTGTTTVASLGNGGSMVYAFEDTVIEDRPGPDFIVFENAFFVGTVPEGPDQDYTVFEEAGLVEVSADGEQWIAFPFDPQALEQSKGGNIDKQQHLALRGLAGITPTFTGNWTIPDDPEVWDPQGQGGVSGAGGDAFDLATVGLAEARFVRITDQDSLNGFPGAGEGFDLDALVVLHGRPVAPAVADGDGDGLTDRAEEEIYGTNPAAADSDGDGTSDGREVAGCRDPLGTGVAPWLLAEPRLWILPAGDCEDLRWSWVGAGATYDLIRGQLESLAEAGAAVDLGPTDCLDDDTPLVRHQCEPSRPAVGQGTFFLVRVGAAADYGRSSALLPRTTDTGCP